MSSRILALLLVAFLLDTSACSSSNSSTSISSFLPKSGSISGWNSNGELKSFTPQNLTDYVDGQSDSFIAYGFKQLFVQKYQDNQQHTLSIEIWQLDTSNDAYGLFTASRAGTPVDIGMGGDEDVGTRLVLWQDRYYVHLNANQNISEDVLMSFAKSIVSALPQGGSKPGLLKGLPPTGLVANSEIFFHQELSIQSEVWLGGTNILGLGTDTDGLVARYSINGQEGHLLLVTFPDEARATNGIKALQAAKPDNLVVSAQNNKVIAAVFGSMDGDSAIKLIDAGFMKLSTQ